MKHLFFCIISTTLCICLSCPAWAQMADSTATYLTLDSCLSLAVQNNRNIRKSELAIEKAKEVKAQAFTKYFPQVHAQAGGYYAFDPLLEFDINDIGNASVRDLLTTLYGNYGAALGLHNTIAMCQYGYMVGATALQPVYMGGKIVAGNRLAQLGVEAAEKQAEMSNRDLLEQVEESYWLLVGLQEKQATVDAALALIDTIQHIAQTAVDAGLVLRTDLMQVELRRSEMERTQIQLSNGIRLATRALVQSVGLPQSVCDSVRVPSVDMAVALSDSLPPLYVDGATTTPEYTLLDMQVEAEKLRRRMTIADALPSVAVGAHYGFSRAQANLLKGGMWGNDAGNGIVFAVLKVPITSWWEMSHKIREHSISVQQAELERDHTDELLSLRNQQTYDKLQEAYLLWQNNRRALSTAQENYRLSEVQYRAGTATISDLLMAQTTLLKAENELSDAYISYRVCLRRYNDLTNANKR